MSTRTQLSLYVPQPAGASLEALRRLLDPIQANLIPAHVTLCREDELAHLPPGELEARLASPKAQPVTLHFGRPVAFDGHGILLPCIAGADDFQALREHLLGSTARRHAPHLTLAHPRNPKSANNHLAHAESLPTPLSFTFAIVRHIEQTASSPWRVLREFPLQSPR